MKRFKQLLSCLLVFAMVSSIAPTVAFAAEDSITLNNDKFLAAIGTPAVDAIKISTAEELSNIKSGNYVLANDIDLSTFNGGEWIPIEPDGNIEIDGQGHIISNLVISECDSQSSPGLIGRVHSYDVILKNIGIENINIPSGGAFIGLYYNDGGDVNIGEFNPTYETTTKLVIDNCYAFGSVGSYAYYGGMLIGKISNESGDYEPGFKTRRAYTNVEIKSCYVSGNVNGSLAGGLIGSCSAMSNSTNADWGNLDLKIADCKSEVSISGDGSSGGMIGKLDYNNAGCICTFTNCTSKAQVTGKDHVGGMVGYDFHFPITFSNCESLCVLSSSDSKANLGAFLGYGQYSSIILVTITFEGKNYYSGIYPIANNANIKNPENVILLQNAPLNPDETIDYHKAVLFLSNWNAENRTIDFDCAPNAISSNSYTVADTVNTDNFNDLVNHYVLVTTKQDDGVLDYIVTDIQPVESAIGEVTATGEHSLTIDGTEYSVRKDFILGSYDGQELLYHIYNGTIMGFDTLETKTGTLDAWDSATGQITIDGTVYPTNYLSNLSFQNDINKYIKQKIKYSISGNGDYRPFIRIDELVKPEIDIAVFSTKKSLTVQKGDSMWLGFCKIYDGQLIDGWSKMAIVVSDPTIISLSEYKKTEFGYALEVTGKKQGATNVVITDTESGASTIVVITVRDSYAGTYSYAIDYMETFYPNNTWEKIQTNIYNLNGLYVNNYRCEENGNKYMVTFDVYNSMYHAGAVDIYDANGNWIDCEEISKYSMSTNMWDSIITEPSFLISDGITGKLLTYEQHSFAKHTPISIEVPEGGYFTISNNFAESPGTFLFNSCDILCDGTFTLIDAVLDVKDKNVDIWAFSKLVKEKITDDKTTREKFIEIFKKTAQKEVQKSLKKFVINEVDDSYADISGLFENILNSLDINWKHLFNSATGVGESILTKSFGPVGIALKGCFAFAKESNQLAQAFNLAASIDAPYATVFSSIGEGENNSHGVIVNTNGNMDTEAVLQVFRVSNNNTIEIILGGNGDHLKKYELYNICFVKNDQLVQPSGKVTVRIPIPDGMQEDTCNVYRQEPDGTWTILTAHIDGNYLVFETDHFSLYGIIGEEDALSISSLPSKTQYSVGETLDVSGLVLSLGGKQITDGFICEPTVLSQAGEQEITVRYGLASAKFNILVRASSESGDSGNTSAGGGSSGGGAAATDSYSITVKNVQNGTVTVSHKSAAKNTTVTITAAPDKGYTLSSVKVLDQSNKEVKLNQTNGKYTFIMPDSKVTVTPTFVAEATKPAETHFVDVEDNAWYAEAVHYVADKGMMNGIGENKFAPNATTTRGMLMTVLARYAGQDTSGSSPWYQKGMDWAVNQKVSDGTNPTVNITREQLVAMLYRYAGSPVASGSLSDFSDTAAVSDYAVSAMQWAVANNIVNGANGNLNPKNNATRAEVAAILMRFCEMNK